MLSHVATLTGPGAGDLKVTQCRAVRRGVRGNPESRASDRQAGPIRLACSSTVTWSTKLADASIRFHYIPFAQKRAHSRLGTKEPTMLGSPVGSESADRRPYGSTQRLSQIPSDHDQPDDHRADEDALA